MKPGTHWLKDTVHCAMLALVLAFSLPQPLHAEDIDLGLEDTSDLDYLEIDEIMAEDENAPRKSVAEQKQEEKSAEAPVEEEEFVDIDAILYGEGTKELEAAAASGQPLKDRKTMQQDMQALKEKVLQVNRDLFVLEEDLLYPSSTQVNVFVSYDALPYFQLDGVSVKINDRPVSNHLYTEREIKAMNRGAVQRLFTGNLPTGEHELVAVVTGIGPEGRDYKRAVSIEFEKTSGTKYIELKIEGDNLRQQPTFRLKQWE
jgi:hypothetical protein